MHDEVRRELARVLEDGLDELRAGLWVASLTYLADAASAVGDRAVAELLYPELEPLTGLNVMIGHGVACYGSGDRYLGMLAATLGDSAVADRHFEAAIELNRRMGAMTWLAHTHFEYGRALLRDAEPERAGEQLAEAGALADRLGLTALRTRIESLGPTVEAPNPSGLSDRELEILRLVARGLSNREIGAELFISEHTAANHIRSILRKTRCANRTEATAFAYEHGLVEA